MKKIGGFTETEIDVWPIELDSRPPVDFEQALIDAIAKHENQAAPIQMPIVVDYYEF